MKGSSDSVDSAERVMTYLFMTSAILRRGQSLNSYFDRFLTVTAVTSRVRFVDEEKILDEGWD